MFLCTPYVVCFSGISLLIPHARIKWLFIDDTPWTLSSTFNAGSRRILGGDFGPNLGEIVALPHLRELRNSGQLTATPIVDSLSELDHDHLIWCTGFRPALGSFRHLMRGREPEVENLHLVGYGNWTGDATATLMGGSLCQTHCPGSRGPCR